MANTIEVNKDMILYIEAMIDNLKYKHDKADDNSSEKRVIRNEIYTLERALELGKIK